MNYKLIKRGYELLAGIIIAISILTVVFIDFVLDKLSVNLLVIISASLIVPFFVLRILYEQEYPVSKKRKMVGYVLGIVLIISTFFI
jgi:hypothetical protein